MQEILIVGAGSVGGFFGAHLTRQHPHVSFLLRPRTLEAVRQRGLTVRSATGTFTVMPRAASDLRELPRPELIILGVKAYDLDEVMDQLEPVLTERTVILTLQNGVDTEDRLRERFKRDCVVGGVAYIYSRIVEPGVIEHYKRGSIAIGELLGTPSERTQRIAALFEEAGLGCSIVGDIRRTKWEKMCWNCVFNPLTVIIDDRISRALDHPELLQVVKETVREVAAVAGAVNVPLAADLPEKVIRWSQEIRDIHTSMYDDWKAGRPTEIDALNGYVVQVAASKGMSAPLNTALTALVKVLTSRERRGSGVVRLEGAVLQPIALDAAALARLPEEHQVRDISAVQPGMHGRGIRLEGLLGVPALAIGADHVSVQSGDDRFAVSLTLEQARQHGILIYELDGQPLPESKGGPFRLITPGLGDLCANVKGVARLELTIGPGPDTQPTPSEKPQHR